VASAQLRETVVIVDEPERSPALRDGLAQRWVVLEPGLNDLDTGAEDPVRAAVAPLSPGPYALIGVSSAASAVIRHALHSPASITALVLVSPLAVRPTGAPAGSTNDLESRLPDIQCPTLAVFGQADGAIEPSAPSLYRSRIPNCNVAFVYGAGHDIAAERPEALLNLVADYLERRETFIVQRRSGAINP
jgi:pimeloyl-ACP methyl ester carboxylesterase